MYVIFVIGFAATARADFSTMPVFTDDSVVASNVLVVQGTLELGTDNQIYLVTETGFVKLVSASDLSEYVGLSVEIHAVDISKTNGSVHATMGNNSGISTVSLKSKVATYLVLEIQEL